MEATIASCHKRLDEDAWRLAEPELVELTRRLHQAETTLAIMSVHLLRHVEERSVPATAGATSTRAWLSQLLRITPRLAKERLRFAAGFQSGFADTGAALGETRINYEQAVAILATVEGLPTKATAEDKLAAERFLLQQAAHLNADDLRRLGKRIDALIDPDGAVPREEAAKTRRGWSSVISTTAPRRSSGARPTRTSRRSEPRWPPSRPPSRPRTAARIHAPRASAKPMRCSTWSGRPCATARCPRAAASVPAWSSPPPWTFSAPRLASGDELGRGHHRSRDPPDCLRRGPVRDRDHALRRPATDGPAPTHRQPDAMGRAVRPRSRLRLPRLHPPGRVLHRPSHRPLGGWRSHGSGQPGPALRPAPRRRPSSGLAYFSERGPTSSAPAPSVDRSGIDPERPEMRNTYWTTQQVLADALRPDETESESD